MVHYQDEIKLQFIAAFLRLHIRFVANATKTDQAFDPAIDCDRGKYSLWAPLKRKKKLSCPAMLSLCNECGSMKVMRPRINLAEFQHANG